MSGISFRELTVWQKAKRVAIELYAASKYLPQSEAFRLATQMRRAAISISSNITEGHMRRGTKEKIRFLRIAHGSGAGLESQIEIARELYPQCDFSPAAGA